MSLEQHAYNPNNAYEAIGIQHNAVVKQVLADYGAQVAQLPDATAKENFIIDACTNTAGQMYGQAAAVDPRPGFATIPGYTGLISDLDVMGRYEQMISGIPGVSPSAAQKIIDLLGPLTTFPVPTEADAVAVLDTIKNFEDQEVQNGGDATVLSFTSVLKFSLVCWWADPNPPGGGVSYFRWDTLLVDGVGFLAGSLAGAAGASTVYHLVVDY